MSAARIEPIKPRIGTLVHDFVIWNNCGVMHRVISYDEDSGRAMHRTTTMGERKLGIPLADVQAA